MKKLLAVLAIVLVACMVVACGNQPATNQPSNSPGSSTGTQTSVPSGQKGKIKIGACPAASDVAFFVDLGKGFKAGAEKYGADVDVQYTERSIEREISLTDTYIAQGYNAVVMDTVDSAAVSGPAKKAADAGLLFACADTIPDEPNLMTISVSSDNERGGIECGKLMKKYLPQGGKIIMQTFDYSSRAMDGRYEGFKKEIEGSGLVIVEEVSCDGSREDFQNKITPILSKYPDLVGIYCSQGDPAMGALTAVEGAGLQDQIKIIAFDVDAEIGDKIRNGSAIVAGVAQFPYEIGMRTIYELVQAWETGKVTHEVILLPILPVEKDTVDEFQKDSTAYLEKYSDYKVQ